MHHHAILFPVFALVTLTFGIAFRLIKLRFSAVKRGDLNAEFYRLNRGEEPPEYLLKVSNNYDNLLALPLLFYVVVGLLYATQQVEMAQIVLAWLFVGCRYWHSYIHIGSNKLLKRARAFALAGIVLIMMWLLFFIRVVQL